MGTAGLNFEIKIYIYWSENKIKMQKGNDLHNESNYNNCKGLVGNAQSKIN